MEYLGKHYNDSMLSDWYEDTMSVCYLNFNHKDDIAVFDAFFRKVPNNGGYAVMAGIDKIINFIKNFKFSDEDIEFMSKYIDDKEYLEYLRNLRFTGSIYAIPDGTPVFPNEPLITVKAPIIEAQIIETALLCMLNGSMEHATGARRIIEATPIDIPVMEFGARRADGEVASIDSSKLGIMAGCVGTSNKLACEIFDLKPMGTIAHSFIETFDDEYEAFVSYIKKFPNNAILLVDTWDTLNSGLPNAIKAFKWMRENNISTNNIGIRIDSGDLAFLSKECRKILDREGFPEAKICLSNGLNAETIESLRTQGACFNSLGVGDNISKPSGRMGAVYKEVAIIRDGVEVPKIKLSNDIVKIINPGYKKLYRIYDKETGYALGDVMCIHNQELNKREIKIVSITDAGKYSTFDNFRLRELQVEIFRDGELVYKDPTLLEKREYCINEFKTIYPEVKRILNPHEYYVDGTQEYVDFRRDFIDQIREMVKR